MIHMASDTKLHNLHSRCTTLIYACYQTLCFYREGLGCQTNIHAFVVKLLCNFSPLRSMISLKQWRSAIGCFSPIVGCELNARTCRHDVTCFISFVPVWLFHFVCGSFKDAVHSESMYSGPTLSYVNRMK